MPTLEKRKSSPSAIVTEYLESQVFRGWGKGGSIRLPPIRSLARQLGVGVSTVQAVYKDFSNKGILRTETKNGSFLFFKGEKDAYRVALNLWEEDIDDPWYREILGGLTLAAARSQKQLTFVPFASFRSNRQLGKKLRDVDAALLFPVENPLDEAASLAKVGVPAIHINPPFDGATFNFISPDYFGACRKIGSVFRESGKKNLLFLSAYPMYASVSACQRLSGLLAGSRFQNDGMFHFNMEFCNGTSQEHGRNAIRKYLERKVEIPDAIFASGDYLAMGCLEELLLRNVTCPETVSVVGGTGLNLSNFPHPGMTRCGQSFNLIGIELFKLILKISEDKDSKLPGVVIPMIWMGGTTTTPKENRSLFPVKSE